MPITGDSFITTLQRPHLEWGSYRHTSSRGVIYGEGYLQIPINEARRIGIYNSHALGRPGVTNVYTCSSVDGFLRDIELKATGCIRAGYIYAKQFHGSGDLKLLGDWFNSVNAVENDMVEIRWLSPTHIEIEKI